MSIIDKPSHNTQKESGKNKVVQKSEPSEETTLSRYLRKVNLLKQEKAKENLKLSEGKGIQKSEDLKEPEVSTKKELAKVAIAEGIIKK